MKNFKPLTEAPRYNTLTLLPMRPSFFSVAHRSRNNTSGQMNGVPCLTLSMAPAHCEQQTFICNAELKSHSSIPSKVVVHQKHLLYLFVKTRDRNPCVRSLVFPGRRHCTTSREENLTIVQKPPEDQKVLLRHRKTRFAGLSNRVALATANTCYASGPTQAEQGRRIPILLSRHAMPHSYAKREHFI